MAIRAAAIPDVLWEQHKKSIQSLYSEHKLSFVMEQMRTFYDFDATDKQYKRRLAKWKIAKNVKSHEFQLLMNDTAAARVLRGQKVSERKVQRHRRRHQAKSLAKNRNVAFSPSLADTFPEGALGRNLRSINDNLSKSNFARQTWVVMQALLLHKMLRLPQITFDATRNNALLIEDITSAGPIDASDLKQTAYSLIRQPQDDNVVFRAAFYLYLRRGRYLLAAEGDHNVEDVPAAVSLATSGHDQWKSIFANWFSGIDDPEVQTAKAHKARSDMLQGSMFLAGDGSDTWPKWCSLMQQTRKLLFERHVLTKQMSG